MGRTIPLVLKGGSFRNCSTSWAAWTRAGVAQRRRLRKRVVRVIDRCAAR